MDLKDNESELERPVFPACRFMVLSDTHFASEKLVKEGPLASTYRDVSLKFVLESSEILDSALETIASGNFDFFVITGDLTKDGEKESHLDLAGKLSGVKDLGIKVFVIPGNHDILNPRAGILIGETYQKTGTVTPDEFAGIYASCGYDDAIERDTHSLSYVAEPVPGLWLLLLDSCIYKDNLHLRESEGNGRLTQPTVDWIESVLLSAVKKRKAVLAFLHHGLLEHYAGQEKYFPDFVLDDHSEVAKMFAHYRIPVVFTGHYHAQDITLARWENPGRVLYDIETASLVSYPFAFREISISREQIMRIKSRFITDIPSASKRKIDFRTEYRVLMMKALRTKLTYEIRKRTSAADADILAPQGADAAMAHFRGDEVYNRDILVYRKGLTLVGWFASLFLTDLFYGLWHDLEPPDNDLIIDLSTLEWSNPSPR